MKNYFVGIDISKDTLDVCVMSENDEKEIFFKVENSVEGVEKMISTNVRKDSQLRYCFENTGNYGLLLAKILENHNLPYYQIPALEIKLSQGIQRGKNDKVDSWRIARYAKVHCNELKLHALPEKEILMIKNLLTYRNHLIKIRTQFKNEKQSFHQINKIADVSYQIDEIAEHIKRLDNNIDLVEKRIQQEIDKQQQISTNYKKITKVKGVGMLTAAYMIVLTNNFTAFQNPRKFNCYAGLAPFEHSSGTSIKGKTKTSKLRNKRIKTVLFNGANSAVIYDEELKSYYKRKKEEGKAHNSIINAVCCKLVYRMFAVVKREEPFVNLVRYNLHMS